MTLPKAVIQIGGKASLQSLEAIKRIAIRKEPKFVKDQKFILPLKNENNDRVKSYLQSRGVHNVITDYLIKKGLLYEDKFHHNAVFISQGTVPWLNTLEI